MCFFKHHNTNTFLHTDLTMDRSMVRLSGNKTDRPIAQKAHLCAPATREIFIEIPDEDPDKDGDSCARLLYSMYGTRDAAKNWALAVETTMRELGFKVGRHNPCIFTHPETGLRALCHGDDFVVVGERQHLTWFEGELKRRFECKAKLLGPRPSDPQSLQVLGRIVSFSEQGVVYEADPRHAERLVEELDLTEAKGVGTPGVKEETKEGEEERLDSGATTRFRAVAARANYLAADRPDLQFASKEVCRAMQAPTTRDWRRLKRLVRYVRDNMRLAYVYQWQARPLHLTAYTDTDWAGCEVTRRSTSSGGVCYGWHLIKSWSKTQASVALSSAEAELAGTVKTTAEALGLTALMDDWQMACPWRTVLMADASAALGIIQRKGAGSIRHLDTRLLWIQEQEVKDRVEYQKIAGSVNPADLGTKYLDRGTIEQHLRSWGLEFWSGRAAVAPGVTKWGPQPGDVSDTDGAVRRRWGQSGESHGDDWQFWQM